MSTPFSLDEVVVVRPVFKLLSYCDCCDEKATLTYRIEIFSGDRFFTCEDCGRKVQFLLNRRESLDLWC